MCDIYAPRRNEHDADALLAGTMAILVGTVVRGPRHDYVICPCYPCNIEPTHEKNIVQAVVGMLLHRVIACWLSGF